ncbi:MAG: hypothetical protein K0B02_05335 [DPANN group archaeon]|nr:hypothetical protein [DPANN group archaeon]
MSICDSSIITDLLGKNGCGVIVLFETSLFFDKEKSRQIERKYQAFKDNLYYGLDSKQTKKIDDDDILILKGLNYFNSNTDIKDIPFIDIAISHKKIPKNVLVTSQYYCTLDLLERSMLNVINGSTNESKELHRMIKRGIGKIFIESAKEDKKTKMCDFFPYVMDKLSPEARTIFLLENNVYKGSDSPDIKYLTESLGHDILSIHVPEPIDDYRVFINPNLFIGSPYVRTSGGQRLTKKREEEIDLAMFFPCKKSDMPNPQNFDVFIQNLYESSFLDIQTGSKISKYQ